MSTCRRAAWRTTSSEVSPSSPSPPTDDDALTFVAPNHCNEIIIDGSIDSVLPSSSRWSVCCSLFFLHYSLASCRTAGGAAFEPLSWSIRLKMAIGAARGLAFLHSSDKQVIYRDFKASNILLDANYNAKLSDFGLAKHGPTGGDSHVTTRVMGTYGYAAPEYVATGMCRVVVLLRSTHHPPPCGLWGSQINAIMTLHSTQFDVYGFGVVLLEMLSGQRALDTNRPSGQHNLVDWARPMLADRRKLARLMDPRLEGQYSSKGAFQAAQLTLSCLAGDPKSRPSMKVVVETLERIEAIKGRSREARDASLQPVVPRSRGHTPVQGRSPPHPRHENAGPGVAAAATHQPHRPS
ncbi:hypothetical protein GW17_00026662 [Ensete ventricosum]|nr:hypothetical protein GW17_00026662 [Ensete ventricosum]